MSTYLIYYKDGAKMMRPVLNREAYLALRNSAEQQRLVHRVRGGETKLKNKLLQMNYSCLPNADGSLRGSKQMSSTIGMDIDHIDAAELEPMKTRILAKKDELGLVMMEKSARGEGLHLVFRRKPELSQEENLKWASALLGVEYDTGAKDITRVFYTTTASQEDLLYLDDAIFENTAAEVVSNTNLTNSTNKEVITNTDGTDNTDNPSKGKDSCNSSDSCSKEKNPLDPNNPCSEIKTDGTDNSSTGKNSCNSSDSCSKENNPSDPNNPCSEIKTDGKTQPSDIIPQTSGTQFPTHYHGIPFTDIIRKYWEVNNQGFEPTVGDRDTLTYQLACDLRHICAKNADWLDQVIPCYNGFSPEEKRAKIKSALTSEYNGFPLRLRNVLNTFKMEDGRCVMEDVGGMMDDGADNEQ